MALSNILNGFFFSTTFLSLHPCYSSLSPSLGESCPIFPFPPSWHLCPTPSLELLLPATIVHLTFLVSVLTSGYRLTSEGAELEFTNSRNHATLLPFKCVI